MRTLHVAAMPFPTPQGTQAIIAEMMSALVAAGRDAHLFTYAGGDPDVVFDFPHHRLSNFPPVNSERSGPSIGKAALDVRMIPALRAHVRRLKPDWVVAHNVEAACIAAAARIESRVYFAHTRFDTELPTYASLPGLAWAGAQLDEIASSAPKIMAITPDLARHLDGVFVMPPWPVGELSNTEERHEARAELESPVLLYAGNLDGYQGLDVLLEAAEDYTLIVATNSDASTLASHPHVHVWPLRNEADRRRAHAAADLVVVPRRAAGGLPIKLLDALARDVRVVAQRRALAGLNPRGVHVCVDDDVTALRQAITATLNDPPRGGREWIAREASPRRFVEMFEAALG